MRTDFIGGTHSNKLTKLEIKQSRFFRMKDIAENPAIAVIYQFQQQLHQLLMHRAMNKKWCRKKIPIFLEMIAALKKSTFKPLVSLGKTLFNWKEEIVRMWRFRKSNGITEGFHRKMQLIKRRTYGFKNFENYRLSVRV